MNNKIKKIVFLSLPLEITKIKNIIHDNNPLSSMFILKIIPSSICLGFQTIGDYQW